MLSRKISRVEQSYLFSLAYLMTKYFILDIFQPKIKRQTDSRQFIVELPWLSQVLQKKVHMTSPIWNPLIFSLNIMGCLTKESATFLKIAEENVRCNKPLV